MTPSECRPGTVVSWYQTHAVIVETPDKLPDRMVDPVFIRTDTGHEGFARAADLHVAPRFLVGGEWRVAPASGNGFIGTLLHPDAQGMIEFEDEGDGLPWGWSCRNGKNGEESTYFAARQAVERACGIERTE